MLKTPDIDALIQETARWFAEHKHLMTRDMGPRLQVNARRAAVMREYERHLAAGTTEQWLAGMEAETLEGRGDWHLELCTVAADYASRRGEAVPPVLRRYTRKVLHATFPPPPRKKKGQHDGSNFSRDVLIRDRIAFIERTYGISPTVNEGTDKDCGCSIVAAALVEADIPELKICTTSAVMSVWQKRVMKR